MTLAECTHISLFIARCANSCSRLFKVMHFRITEKLTTDCVSLCNNAGHISTVSEKNSQRKRWKLPLSTAPLSSDAPCPGNFREHPHTSPHSRVIDLHFCCWQYGSIFIHFLWLASKTHLFCNKVRIGRSRSSKVVDFGTNRKGVCDFLLVINSNFGHILHRFWDTATYWLKIVNFSYTPLSFNVLARGEPFRISGWTFYRQN